MNRLTENWNSTKTRNLIIFICSLLSALLLWIYVTGVENQDVEKTYRNIPIEVRHANLLKDNYGLTMITSSQLFTDVTLSGKRTDLNKLKNDEIKIFLDLSGVEEAGDKSLPVRHDTLPVGVKYVSSSSDTIMVTVDKIIDKEFEIAANANYIISSAYEVEGAIVTDSESNELRAVRISGPQKEIDAIASVRANVDFGEIDSTTEAKTNLVMYDSLGNPIISSKLTLSHTAVKVKIPVYTEKKLRLTVEQAYGTFAEDQINFRISPSEIAVKGDPKVLSKMDTLMLDAINEKQIGLYRTGSYKITIKVPEGMTITSNHSVANVTATLSNSVVRNTVEFPTSKITLKHLDENLECSFKKDELTLTAFNSTESTLDEKDVNVILDLTDYTEPGTYTATVSASTIDRISYAYIIDEGGDYSVTFTIKAKK